MQQPTLNGVMKPQDVIARGPHRYDKATRKYEEVQSGPLSEYPRAMWHETEGYKEVGSREEQVKLEASGWTTKAIAEKPKKDTMVASPVNLAEVLLQQELEMKSLRAKLEALTEKPKAVKA